MNDFEKNLAQINSIIPPIFELRYEDNDLNIYVAKKSEILDKNMQLVPNYVREATLISGTKKEILNYLKGMLGLSVIFMNYNQALEQVRKEQMEKMKGDNKETA